MIRSIAPVLLGLWALAASAAEPESERWESLRQHLFADRPIVEDAGGVVELDAPVRAEDAAVVPIALRTKLEPGADRWVRKLWLIVDRNPSPVGAIFTFTRDSGRAEVETRIRVEEYTFMRAVAETSDGKLYMATRYVKASGGCSAPAGKDLEAAMSRIGKMKFGLEKEVTYNQPNQAQLMISHPNLSGLAMDQVTRLYTPAHFVRKIDVTYAGKPVLTAEVDFTISENPNFRFWFTPRGEGELKAQVVDSNELKFESSLKIREGAGS